MVYYVVEGTMENRFNAGSKARNDIELILDKRGINKLYIPTKKEVAKNKLMKFKEYLMYKKNTKIWDDSLKSLNKGDILIIQYPLAKAALKLKNVIKKYKGIITFIAIIHDLDSIRFDNQSYFVSKKQKDEDKNLLNQMDKIIAHNSSMKNELIKLGNKEENIIELQLFDYLTDNVNFIDRNINDPIVIAGNLSYKKAGYLKDLNKINYNFNLYGINFDESMKYENIEYKGKFLPEELVNYLEGSFGLVWDGPSINTCTTKIGEYLKYNNPHKVSLYLTSGLPVIVWSKSALAPYITSNKLGLALDDLSKVDEEIKKLSNDEYNVIVENTRIMSNKLRNGYFINEALNKLIRGQDEK